jgi:hypothetical protein
MRLRFVLTLIFASVLLAACGRGQLLSAATETIEPSVTPDPCISPYLDEEVARVNDLMREFDDYSDLASHTPQAQLVQIIPELQRIQRAAEDQEVPACLDELKEYQLNHMNLVVQTLLAFVSQSDSQVINAGIAQAQQLHKQYEAEMARLLGVTLPAPADTDPLPATPEAGAPTVGTAANVGTTSVILLSAPDPNAGGVAELAGGGSTPAFGQTADGKWIQVEVPGQPGQKAWVDATLVVVSGTLPVVTP